MDSSRSAAELPLGEELLSAEKPFGEAPEEVRRPRTRADCVDGPRPCPFVSCKHHLMWALPESDIQRLADGEAELDLEESCTLDVADRDGVTLEEVGHLFRVTRERIRQIEKRAMAKLRAEPPPTLAEFVPLEVPPRPPLPRRRRGNTRRRRGPLSPAGTRWAALLPQLSDSKLDLLRQAVQRQGPTAAEEVDAIRSAGELAETAWRRRPRPGQGLAGPAGKLPEMPATGREAT